MKERDEKDWLKKIASAGGFETPYFLTDLSVVRRKARQLHELLPRVKIYYAIKSNPDAAIINELKDEIAGFDIASLGEFRHLRGLGIAPERIVYSNPVKIPKHIAETYAAGVNHFAFDSLEEIQKLKRDAPGATVYLRLKVQDYGSKFPLSAKFGVDEEHAANFAALAADAGLQVKGLTFHVGSQAENPRVWDAALSMCHRLIGKLAKQGITISFIDIGGGLPARYEDVAPGVTEAAKAINEALAKYIPEDIEIYAEPGRFISANTSVLVTSIIGREHRSGADWLYLDMGVFQGLMEPLEMPDWHYPVFTRKHPQGHRKSFVLTGPSCDSYDTIGLDYSLPSDLNVGDQLFIGAAGAYSVVYGSNFNGFEVPHTYYVNAEQEGNLL